MTIYLENETEICFDFDLQGTADLVAEKILELEACPYETRDRPAYGRTLFPQYYL